MFGVRQIVEHCLAVLVGEPLKHPGWLSLDFWLSERHHGQLRQTRQSGGLPVRLYYRRRWQHW